MTNPLRPFQAAFLGIDLAKPGEDKTVMFTSVRRGHSNVIEDIYMASAAGKASGASKYVRSFAAWDELEPEGLKFVPTPEANDVMKRYVDLMMRRITLECAVKARYLGERQVGNLWVTEVGFWKPAVQEHVLTFEAVKAAWETAHAGLLTRVTGMTAWNDLDAPKKVTPRPWPRYVRLRESLLQFWRKPRSKKGRIVKKWRKRAENWRPHPQVFGEFLSVGSKAARHGYGCFTGQAADEGVRAPLDVPPMGAPVGFLAHPATWVAWCEREPNLRALEVLW